MAARNSITARLERLEHRADAAGRFAHLTNDELAERLSIVTSDILARIGGTPEKGYAGFRQWYGKPAPDTLDAFMAESVTFASGGMMYAGAIEQFAIETTGGGNG